jgi:hypothetical protein
LDLEAEVFVKVGAWKNFDEMEENLCLAELDFLIKAIRHDQRETRVFAAALKGIDLDKYADNSVEEKRREIERRAAERQFGIEEVERQELALFGITFEES